MVNIEIEQNILSLKTQLLVFGLFSDEISLSSISDITSDFDPLIQEIIGTKEFDASNGTMCIIHNKVGSRIKRILLLGLGEKKKIIQRE